VDSPCRSCCCGSPSRCGRTLASPQLEVVGAAHSVAQSAPDSPSLQAFNHIGKVFGEFDSDSAAMIVLEGDRLLGADAHHFYDELALAIILLLAVGADYNLLLISRFSEDAGPDSRLA
jgi:uncharacterized membrane protein YdfJ with MMPL/SSD domain